MEWFVFAYLFALVLLWCCALLAATVGNEEDRRESARMAVLAPLWPILLPWALWAGARNLWRATGW